MTIFRLKQLASSSAHAVAGAVRWNYDRAELIADGVVHGIGVFCGVIAATVLVVLTAVYATGFEVAVVSVYVAGLLTMLVLSATYNLWPISRAKWVLRRFDHSAIYVLIAATYTPFITQMKDSVFAIALSVHHADEGQRFCHRAVDRRVVRGDCPAGGVLYSFGIVFHAWQRLRFQNAIWHSFVLLGAACHYTAVLDLVVRT